MANLRAKYRMETCLKSGLKGTKPLECIAERGELPFRGAAFRHKGAEV